MTRPTCPCRKSDPTVFMMESAGDGLCNDVSGHALIEGNTVALNGSPGETPWNSQILVSGSIDTLVQRNRVGVAPDSGNAIFIVEEGRKNELIGYIHDFPTYVSRGNVVADNHITFYDSISVSGFQSNHGRVQDLVENNRFEGNSINLVQGTTKRFRIGSEYLDLEQAQQRGQEKHSRAEFVPSGTSRSFYMKCPPNVGRREERK